MIDVMNALAGIGGIAHLSTLAAVGIAPSRLHTLVNRGLLVRPRQGWYAVPGVDPALMSAVSLGGSLSCVSALKRVGVWCVDDNRLHVRVPRNAARLGGIAARATVHYYGPRVTDPADDIVLALALACRCQSRENAIVAMSSALNLGLIGPEQLVAIRSIVARKYGRYIDAADGTCESGLETKCVLRLRRLNLRVRTQAYIRGVGRVDVLVGDRLVIELDGIQFHSGIHVQRDRRRDLELHRLGYIVLRVDYHQVMDAWDEVEDVIRGYTLRGEHHWSARHARAGLG